MSAPRRIALALALAALLLGAVFAGFARSFAAAWRAFRSPELVEPSPPLPAPAPLPVDLSDELDRQLGDDYRELTHHHPALEDAAVADLLPEELPLPISRRALRFVRFFTSDPDGRRAFEVMYRRSGRYRDGIDHALRAAGLPADLVWLAAVESTFEPNAVSPRGAVGIWQFMPGTARDYGLVINPYVDERRSPRRSTEAAVLFLRDLWEELGELDLALSAYNAGRLRVQNAVDELAGRREARGLPPSRISAAELAREGLLPRETADYVPKIIAVAIVASNLERFELTHLVVDDAEHTSPVVVPAGTKLATIARAASISPAELRRLNPELLRERLPAGFDFEVQLPAQRLNHALVTLPVYLADAEVEPAAPETVPRLAMAPMTPALVFDFPELTTHRGQVSRPDPMRALFGQALPLVTVGDGPVLGATKTKIASGAERAMTEALVDAAASRMPERDVGAGVMLRVRPDATARQVAITVRVDDVTVTEVVPRDQLEVGLAFAAGRLALFRASRDEATTGALRARLNRHRRIGVEKHAAGRGWLALGDALFPVGDASHGRLIATRGPDASWQRDRLLLAALEAGSASSSIDVAGDVDPAAVEARVTALVAELGMGLAGRLPVAPAPSERLVEVTDLAPRRLIGWRGPGRTDGDHAALIVAFELLAGEKRSRLATALAGDVPFAAVVDADENDTVVALDLGALPEGRQLERVWATMTSLARERPSRVELAYATAMAQIRLRRRVEREHGPGLSATKLLEARDPEASERLLAALERVEADDVVEVAESWLARDRAVVVVMGPKAAPSLAAR